MPAGEEVVVPNQIAVKHLVCQTDPSACTLSEVFVVLSKFALAAPAYKPTKNEHVFEVTALVPGSKIQAALKALKEINAAHLAVFLGEYYG